MRGLRDFTDRELARELAHARNRRDSHSRGSAGERPHVQRVAQILAEQDRRREARRAC